MRKIRAWLPWLVLLAVLAMAAQTGHMPNWTATSSPRVPWRKIGTITTAQATLAVNARDYSTVVALSDDVKTIQWLNIPDDGQYAEFRFSTTADADSHVVEIWVAANDYTTEGTEDSFTLAGTATLTGGKQVGPYSNYFVDTIATSDALLTSVVSDSGQDRMAILRYDLRGWKKVVIIATQLENGTTIYCDARWF